MRPCGYPFPNWMAGPSNARTFGTLNLRLRLLQSSSLGIDRHLRGKDRVKEIVQVLNGRIFNIAPGGHALNRAAAFQQRGLNVKFLVPYAGASGSILPALFDGDVMVLEHDIRKSVRLAG